MNNPNDQNFLQAIKELPCILCNKPPPNTPSHIKTRGSGGKDQYFNVTPMCLPCHSIFESNRSKVILNTPHFKEYLETLGWKFYFYQQKFIMEHSELVDRYIKS